MAPLINKIVPCPFKMKTKLEVWSGRAPMQRFKRLTSTGMFRSDNVLPFNQKKRNIKSKQPSTGDYFCENLCSCTIKSLNKTDEDDSLKEYDSHPSPNIANFLLSNPHLVYLPDGFLCYFFRESMQRARNLHILKPLAAPLQRPITKRTSNAVGRPLKALARRRALKRLP